ncbi:MAG: hypothetical protein AB7P76_08710 [Candidatus Melainabacteria bacterium]
MGDFLANVNRQIGESLRYAEQVKRQQAEKANQPQNQAADVQDTGAGALNNGALQSMFSGMNGMQMMMMFMMMNFFSQMMTMTAPPPPPPPAPGNALAASLSADLLKAMFAPSLNQPAAVSNTAGTATSSTGTDTEDAVDEASETTEETTPDTPLTGDAADILAAAQAANLDLSGATPEELASADKAITWLTGQTENEPSPAFFANMQDAFANGDLGFSEMGVILAIMLQGDMVDTDLNPDTPG